jgi:hypothetical protein
MSRQDRDMDPRLAAAFAELRAESDAPADPGAVASARAAMYRAVADREQSRGLLLLLQRSRRALSLHRVLAGAAGTTMALSAVTALGWNAPAGAPLHLVELAHEQISLALPGTDRAAADLGYAEARLDQAARGDSEGEALGEAQRLLDDAHGYLPADHGNALWARWQTDSGRLVALRTDFEQEAQTPPHTPPASSAPAPAEGSRETTSTKTSTGSRSSEAHSTSRDEHESHSSTTSTPSGDEAHSSHGSSTTTTSSGHGGTPPPEVAQPEH